MEHSPFADVDEVVDVTSPATKGCPRCGAEARALTLLTRMTRYYICSACSFRWSASRPDPVDGILTRPESDAKRS